MAIYPDYVLTRAQSAGLSPLEIETQLSMMRFSLLMYKRMANTDNERAFWDDLLKLPASRLEDGLVLAYHNGNDDYLAALCADALGYYPDEPRITPLAWEGE